MMEYAATSPLLAPFALAMLALVVPRCAALAGLLGTLSMMVSAAAATLCVVSSSPTHVAIGGWAAPLGIELRLDGLSAVFLATIGVVSFIVAVWAALEPHSRRDHWFWALFLFCIGGMAALVVTADAFHAYVAFELVTVAAVSLVAIKGTPAAIRAALSYLVVAVAAGLLYVAGVAFVYAASGELELARMRAAGNEELHTLGCSMMVAGLLVKAALVPLHGWLPAAHSSATPPVSALLSALVVKGPIVVLVRLHADVLSADFSRVVGTCIGILGGVAVIWGSVQALRAIEVKRLVAYSTVAQLGYMFLAFALAPPAGIAGLVGVVIVAHAVAKAALFLAVGGLAEAGTNGAITSVAEAAARRPLAAGAVAMSFISLVGLPPTLGFAGKWGLLGAAVADGVAPTAVRVVALVVVAGGTLLSAAYAFRLVRFLMAGSARPSPPVAVAAVARDVSALGLAAAALGLGLVGGHMVTVLAEPGRAVADVIGGP